MIKEWNSIQLFVFFNFLLIKSNYELLF